MSSNQYNGTEVAIIGMAGRFPGARDTAELWRNVRDGVDAVRRLTAAELAALGVPASLRSQPGYVPMTSQMPGLDRFDALFFGFNHREAEVLDPQQRILLELAWEAMESAGYAPDGPQRAVGVFAGATLSTYLLFNLMANPALRQSMDPLQVLVGNAGDSLATRVSYKLNLKGPSFAVQSACSTSLVAAHLACSSLLDGECDLALAGAVSINVNLLAGFLSQEGGVFAPDGRCRAFDAGASGILFGHGGGVLVLKRLADALADGDTVRAVIRGSAVNNDGSFKVGYTAPSVEGQAEVLTEAWATAGIDPSTLSYIEAHGTGTRLGDPIEIQALTRAFRPYTTRRGFCALGSVKTNIGHLDVAAGAAGMIKTVLALEHRQIPPNLHFDRANPVIDFAASPVRVATTLSDWPAVPGQPRRAGVSSFGFGGTNAHVVLEEAPPSVGSPSRPWDLLPLSARSDEALEHATEALAAYCEGGPWPAGDAGLALSDTAFTLQVGRRRFTHRRALACRPGEDVAALLRSRDPQRVLTLAEEATEREVAFLLPGLGDQYAGMGAGLYRDEPVFRREVDRCAEILTPLLGRDIREVLFAGARDERSESAENPAPGAQPGDAANAGTPPFPSAAPAGPDLRRLLRRPAAGATAAVDAGAASSGAAAGGELARTVFAHPATFVVEYALARTWMSWGVRPAALLGYSLGEYVAACLAEVFSLQDALTLVAARARAIEELPAGAMLAVPLAEDEVLPMLAGADRGGLAIAAVNGPSLVVVAGPVAAIDALARRLADDGVASSRLNTAHAFHSPLMQPVADRVTEVARRLTLKPPAVPVLSNVTGTWLTAEEATDPTYWAAHLCRPVRFAAALAELWRAPERVLLEIGPGQLGSLALQHPDAAVGSSARVLAALRLVDDPRPDGAVLMVALAKLWLLGVRVDWKAFHAGEKRRRIPLPTYPFERRRYWLDAPGAPRPLGMLDDPAEVARGEQLAALADAMAGLAATAAPAAGTVASGASAPILAMGPMGTASADAADAADPVAAGETGAAPASGLPVAGAVAGVAAQALHPRPRLFTPYVAPRDDFERRLAAIWGPILGVEPVGVNDSFLQLGGHSLMAAQVLSRVREVFAVELPVQRLFATPTVAELAVTLRDLQARRPDEAAEIRPRPAGLAELPLSYTQERMWFLHQLDPLAGVYNLFTAARVSGPLRVAVLRRALGEVVRRHEVLRSSFPLLGNHPVQQVAPPRPMPIPVVDLAALPAPARGQEAWRLEDAEQLRPFDMANGPLLRMTLLRLTVAEHAMLISQHHIASDGWSSPIIVRELEALYGAYGAGLPSPLPELPIQYGDYAVWQRQHLGGGSEVEAEHLAYWQRQLGGNLPVLRLPTDHPRSAVQGFEGRAASRVLSPRLAAQLKTGSQAMGATLFMTLFAGFTTLLYRYSGETDILIGSPNAGRTRAEIEPLVGNFLNTLVLRAGLDPGISFADLVARVRVMTLEALAHQDLPLENVLRGLTRGGGSGAADGSREAERDAARASLFQAMFLFQNNPTLKRLRFADLDLSFAARDLNSQLGTAIFDLCLVMEETEEGGMLAWISYNGRLFEPATIERMLAHFESLLIDAVADPGQTLAALRLAPAAERAQLLAWSAGPRRELPNGETAPAASPPTGAAWVHQRIGLQALQRPRSLAVTRLPDDEAAAGDALTYAELDRRANRLAHHLRRLGVGPDVLVALYLERSPWQVVAMLAVLKAGGAYVPLDPATPAERLALILEDSRAPVLIGERRLEASLPAAALMDRRAVWLDAEGERAAIDAEADGDPLVPVTAENLAYVIYTSGSTGRPKGVMVSHGALANFAAAAGEYIGVTAEDRVLQFAAVVFDASAEEIYPCLCAGATLVLRNDAMLRSGADFATGCRAAAITVADLPSGFLQEMIAGLESSAAAWPPTLRHLIIGGERTLPERVAPLRRAVGPGVEVLNTYGPTETTVVATVHAFHGAADAVADGHELPIGRPIANLAAYVVDAAGELAPVGVPGELLIGGAGLARGYLGRPELTARAFVPDAWSALPGARLYRTGDLVRWLAAGELEFLGRIDFQIKIRGYRVELGDIEAALVGHPAVGDAVVVAHEPQPGTRRLAAYWTARQPADGGPGVGGGSGIAAADAADAGGGAALRAYLKERLPEYMVPASFLQLTALPRNSSGKVERRALPPPEPVQRAEVRPFIAPRTEAEEAVAAIWSELLGVAQVGVEDDFYALGGHSMSLVQVRHRLQKEFGVEVPLRSLVEENTVAALALAVEDLLLAQIEAELETAGGG